MKNHPIIFFLENKLKHYGRRDYCFNFEPLKNTRVEVHRVVNSPFLFVRVARRVVNKVTESLIIEEWIPIEEYKFFFGEQGNIRSGSLFLDQGSGWTRYSPSRVAKDGKLKQKLQDLKKLVKKANRLHSYP